MKKLVVRLTETLEKLKEWMKQCNRNDDDYFDHPFAIF
jgi:hypothetical protein